MIIHAHRLRLQSAPLRGGPAVASASTKLALIVFQPHLFQKEIGHELSQASIFKLELGDPRRRTCGFALTPADRWRIGRRPDLLWLGLLRLGLLSHFAPAMNGHNADAERFADFSLRLPFGRKRLYFLEFRFDLGRAVTLFPRHFPNLVSQMCSKRASVTIAQAQGGPDREAGHPPICADFRATLYSRVGHPL
jgi:hypothetical protein